jgi:hypothetical protein
MKKLTLALLTSLVFSTASIAHPVHDPRWGVNNHHGNFRGNGISTGEAVAIIGGLAILGTIINNNNRNRETIIIHNYPQQLCQDIVRYDYYGNPYVVDRRCR